MLKRRQAFKLASLASPSRLVEVLQQALFLLYVIVTFEAGAAGQTQDERCDECEEESVQELAAVDSVSLALLPRYLNESVVAAAASSATMHRARAPLTPARAAATSATCTGGSASATPPSPAA